MHFVNSNLMKSIRNSITHINKYKDVQQMSVSNVPCLPYHTIILLQMGRGEGWPLSSSFPISTIFFTNYTPSFVSLSTAEEGIRTTTF